MCHRSNALVGLALAFLSGARADFSVEQTTRITGGTILRYSRLLGGRLATPLKATISVKGGKMVHRTETVAHIIDLGAQTITTVNPVKRTYTVIRFEQLQSAHPPSPKVDGLKVNIVPGTARKKLLDRNTLEKILTVSMTIEDSHSGKQSDAHVESDMFLARNIPGAEELRQFYWHMSGIPWTAGGMPGVVPGMNSEIAEGVAHAYRSSKQLDGLPLLTLLTVNGVIPGVPTSPAEGALMKMTVEVLSWSNKPLDESLFRVPDGYQLAALTRAGSSPTKPR